MYDFLLSANQFIARAGGGGTGGGSGGGGSSYSSTGGNGGSSENALITLYIVLGVIVYSLICIIIKQETKKRKIIFGIIYIIIMRIPGFIFSALEGSSGRYLLIDLIMIFVLNYNEKNSIGQKILTQSSSALNKLKRASQKDPAWNKDKIIKYARSIFINFQKDWQNKDIESIRKYTTPEYAEHIELMLEGMTQLSRKNILNKINIIQLVIDNVNDQENDNFDSFSITYKASIDDKMIENGKTKSSTKETFIETWNYIRRNDKWLISGVKQETENKNELIKSLKEFAKDNKMYYSPDWGTLLMPNRGHVFQSSFKDINNHIIGYYRKTKKFKFDANYKEDLKFLTQLYTYNCDSGKYLIGQVSIPQKKYDGILVINNQLKLKKPSNKYQKHETSWIDFNKKYTLYTKGIDEVKGFKLLNPRFMEWLSKRKIKINIEVVDNLIYFYTDLRAADDFNQEIFETYKEMLNILTRAYEELEL